MANVFDTAAYILEKAGPLSPMKLQKLCYYSQAWSFAWDGKFLFDEDFQAWANGPVCPELFYKTHGKILVIVKDAIGGEGDLTDNQRETIDRVLNNYVHYDAHWLCQLTQMEDPWIKARTGVPRGSNCNNVINKDNISIYYRDQKVEYILHY